MADLETKKCTSAVHKTGKEPPAVNIYLYHDGKSMGGLPTSPDPESVEVGDYGIEAAYLCAACSKEANENPPFATTLLRVIAL